MVLGFQHRHMKFQWLHRKLTEWKRFKRKKWNFSVGERGGGGSWSICHLKFRQRDGCRECNCIVIKRARMRVHIQNAHARVQMFVNLRLFCSWFEKQREQNRNEGKISDESERINRSPENSVKPKVKRVRRRIALTLEWRHWWRCWCGHWWRWEGSWWRSHFCYRYIPKWTSTTTLDTDAVEFFHLVAVVFTHLTRHQGKSFATMS